MRRYAFRPNVPTTIVAFTLAVALMTGIAAAASTPTVDRGLADSLARQAAGYYAAEPSTQKILDSLGWGLSAIKNQVATSRLSAAPGMVVVRVISKNSGQAENNSFGWYPAGSPGDTLALLPGIATPADSVVFSLPSPDSLCWFISRDDGTVWYSEKSRNADHSSHVKIYPSPRPGEYLLCWEDLALPGDGDYNDLVVLVRLPSATPAQSSAGPTSIAEPVAVAPQAKTGSATTQSLAAGVESPMTAKITIKLYDTLKICAPETLCVPFSVASGCALTQLKASSPGFVKLPDSTLCVYVDRTSSFYVSLVAIDQCGAKDSVRVLFTVTRYTPAAVIAPTLIDTLLCQASWICFPIATTGTTPVTVTAVSPAIFNANTKTVCYKVNSPGTYHIVMIASNACGPETTVTEVRARFNTRPTILGVPNDTVRVCQIGPYCFGPVTCYDADSNLISCSIWNCPGSYDGQYWCYTPTSKQTVPVVFRAADACGAVFMDTLIVKFGSSVKPTITMQNKSVSLCHADTVCLPFSISNPGGRPLQLSLIGTGILRIADSTVCRAVTAGGAYTVKLVATDDCGTADTVQATINVTMDNLPVVTCTTPSPATVCAGAQVCMKYTVTDADGGTLNVNIDVGGNQTVRQEASGTTDSVCVTINQSGSQTVRVIATDACGGADTCSSTFTMTVNSPPVASARDTAVSLCSPQQICIPYSCSDPDNNLTTCVATGSKAGTANGSTFCFTPDTAGVYHVTVQATDACGLTNQKTINVIVSYNTAPTIVLSDTARFNAADKETVCVAYTATDPEGKPLVITNIGGIVKTATQQFCVVASSAGPVCARIIATDPCGKSDTAQLCVVTQTPPNPTPKPTVPDTIKTRFCGVGDKCIKFSIGPSACPPLTVTGLNGGVVNMTDSTLCLHISEIGTYVTGIIAHDGCGTDTTIVVMQIKTNNAPVIVCPQPETFHICHDTTICITVAFADPDSNFASATVTYGSVAPAFKGLFKICFPVDTSGWYTSRLIVRDSCGAADTCNLSEHIVHNTPPQILLPKDTTIFLCFPRELCFPASCFDPDYNITACGPASLGDAHWDGSTLCFTPIVAGTYQWVFSALDACGATAIDTFRVIIKMNHAPVITVAPTAHFVVCSPESVCVPFQVSDADGDSLKVFPSEGTVRNGMLCLYRATSGTDCVQLIVRDPCCFADTANVCVTIDVNTPPTVIAPPDFVRNACGLGNVCFKVQISDDRPRWTAAVSPIGTFNPADTSVCFYADTGGVYRLIVIATDSCGATGRDTVNVTVKFNRPPTVSAPPTKNVAACAPGMVCVNGIATSDPDGNMKRVYLSSGSGILDVGTGTICFTANTAGTYCFEITAEDSCGATASKTMCVVVSMNVKPTVNISGLPSTALYLHPTQICFGVAASDPNVGQLFDLEMLEGAGVFARQVSHATIATSHCFLADTTGCYRFIFQSADSCGLVALDTATICVRIEPPDSLFQICIDTVSTLSGRNVVVKTRGYRMMPMGGYNFLICYDPTVLRFSSVVADTALAQWEYFTYRTGSSAGCLPCGDGTLRLIGIADMNNGSAHPPVGAFLPKGPMHDITFSVTADRSFINQCGYIRFCSNTCSDNTVSSVTGDTLYTSFTGVPDSCFTGPKSVPIRAIQFCDGAVCIIPPPDDRGDINLNGVADEVADAVLFSNWFIYGDKVWDPIYKDAQILATDVNCDGLVLTISDLVTLIRIITGDAVQQGCPGGPKIAVTPTHEAAINVERQNGRLAVSVSCDADLGGIFVHLKTTAGNLGQVTWAEDLGGLTAYQSVETGEVRALLVAKRSGVKLASGLHPLFSVPWDGAGEWKIVEAQAATSIGDVVTTELAATGHGVPATFQLEQNYPNPFNATTQIRFSLGQASKWELTIYNVLGQPVRQFQGENEAGSVTVEWNAATDEGYPVASGMYFARLKAGEFSATKKMVLLK